MKILMAAVFSPTSTNNSQADGFEKNGCEVIRFNYRAIASKIGNAKRDTKLVGLCKKEQPDLVFFSKCNEVDIGVIHECNKISKTVLWYMDPQNTNFNESLKAKIQHCTLTFCALWKPYLAAKEIAKGKIYFLHEGYDHTSNYPINVPYKHNVSFIGALRNERKIYYQAIGFHIYNNAFGKEHSKAVSESRINLNFTEGGTSDRTYKVLASRGFLLTQPWPNLNDDFKDGKDLITFHSASDLKKKIEYYLNNEQERLKIAEHGHKTIQKFNRVSWAKRIIDSVEE